MMDLLTFEKENQHRIQAVENSFGTAGRPLSKPGRFLMGEGRLMKQGRRKPQPKDFYLFNDLLVYGSIILNGRWHKNQKIIPLEDIQLEDMEDGVTMTNQWLLRTPSKSFFVSASSFKEKQAWMNHIEECRLNLLRENRRQPGSVFASSWIPDQATYRCMRCLGGFTGTKRRHHCRSCGFVVCNTCSKQRAVISHIHPTKKLRVCRLCYTNNEKEESGVPRPRGNSICQKSSEEDSDNDEEGVKGEQSFTQSNWLDSRLGTWGRMSSCDFPTS
uniref:Pleckstrin homology and FYVE domain containing 1 n=2 Tax=Labrus bergylta TaxID=56723 RepID=A0A3Q3NQM5_9LABR